MRQVEPKLVTVSGREEFPALIPSGQGGKMQRPQMAVWKSVAWDVDVLALHDFESRNCHEIPVPGNYSAALTGPCVLSGSVPSSDGNSGTEN